MGSMFANCSSLTDLMGLHEWDTSSVTYMSSMFANCSSLTSLDLSSWNVRSVEGFENMFYNCSKLTTIGDLSGWCACLMMGGMFYNCSVLTADCSSWDLFDAGDMISHYDFNTNAPGVIPPKWTN